MKDESRNHQPAVINDAENFPPPAEDVVKLDDATARVIGEMNRAIDNLIAQRQGALTVFMHQRGLSGEWQCDAAGRELRRKPAERPADK